MESWRRFQWKPCNLPFPKIWWLHPTASGSLLLCLSCLTFVELVLLPSEMYDMSFLKVHRYHIQILHQIETHWVNTPYCMCRCFTKSAYDIDTFPLLMLNSVLYLNFLSSLTLSTIVFQITTELPPFMFATGYAHTATATTDFYKKIMITSTTYVSNCHQRIVMSVIPNITNLSFHGKHIILACWPI